MSIRQRFPGLFCDECQGPHSTEWHHLATTYEALVEALETIDTLAGVLLDGSEGDPWGALEDVRSAARATLKLAEGDQRG